MPWPVPSLPLPLPFWRPASLSDNDQQIVWSEEKKARRLGNSRGIPSSLPTLWKISLPFLLGQCQRRIYLPRAFPQILLLRSVLLFPFPIPSSSFLSMAVPSAPRATVPPLFCPHPGKRVCVCVSPCQTHTLVLTIHSSHCLHTHTHTLCLIISHTHIHAARSPFFLTPSLSWLLCSLLSSGKLLLLLLLLGCLPASLSLCPPTLVQHLL